MNGAEWVEVPGTDAVELDKDGGTLACVQPWGGQWMATDNSNKVIALVPMKWEAMKAAELTL